MIKLLKRMRRREALMALVCAVLVVAQVYFDLKLPDYMTRLTTLIKTPGSVTSDILSVGGQMLLCTLASAVLAVGCGYLAAKTASGFSFSVRADLFHHVMDAGSEEMQSFSVPSLITRTTNDITQIQMIVAMGLQMLMKAPIMAVWAVIKILGKSWTLSAVTGGFVVAIVVMVLLIMSSCLPRFRQVQKKTDQINRVARENLTGINVVHAFGAEDYQNRKFDGPSRDMMNLQLKNQRLFALLQPMLGLGMNGLALAIYWVGAALVESIALTDPAARLTMFSECTGVQHLRDLRRHVLHDARDDLHAACRRRRFRLSVSTKCWTRSRTSSPVAKTEGERARLRSNSVTSPSAIRALRRTSWSISASRCAKVETLAVIGATGSGKTTLASASSLVFTTRRQGTVLVDGVDVRDVHVRCALQQAWLCDAEGCSVLRYDPRTTCSSARVRQKRRMTALQAALSACRRLRNLWTNAAGRAAAPHRPAWPERLRRAEAAAFHRTGAGKKAGNSDFRRFVLRAGLQDRRSAARGACKAAARHDKDHRCPAHQHYPQCRSRSSCSTAARLPGIGTHDELMQSCPVYREIAMSQLSEEELAKGRRRVQMRPNMRPMEKTYLKGALQRSEQYMRKSLRRRGSGARAGGAQRCSHDHRPGSGRQDCNHHVRWPAWRN